ncbi:MAG: sulfatase [Thermoanaerobaculia bacterium]
MNRRRQSAALGVAIALALGLVQACAGPPTVLPDFSEDGGLPRPNVLVVLIDALRRDHLGAYGYELPTSPNIDAFAAESVVFNRAYSHSSWTKPSVATLFTSLYPDQHGLGRVGFEGDAGFETDVLPKPIVTMAERFRQSGYRTGSIGTNVHILKKTGFAQGFDHFFNKRLVTAYRVNRLLRQWVESGDADKPFFAYAHYMDVHFPYNRKLPDETGRFGNSSTRPRAPEHWTRVPEWAAKHMNPRNLAAFIASYDEEVAYTDGAFGELIAWLRESGLIDDTVVVLVADHGEGFNEHDELQHGYAPYEEVTSIPMMVRLPPVYGLAPRTVDDVVGLVDVMPTVLDLVGIDLPRSARGRSLSPLLLGQPLRVRPVYVEGPGVRGLRGVTHTVFVREDGGSSCFDNLNDPGESAPLTEPLPEICSRMARALEGLVAQFALVADGDEATVELDAEEVEALRALGYLD